MYEQQDNDFGGIQPYSENRFYWEYKGTPVLLLGGTWQDNLFNHPTGLEQHLELLQSVGGNYVRNVMSHRNVGNVFPYIRDENNLFDLERFNSEYWQRFENFLSICHKRDIIVQIEIWDPWDYYIDHQSFGGWSYQPFNPENNINYTASESGMPTEINYAPQGKPTEHPFFRTVPSLNNNLLILKHQTAFVDKLLSISMKYANILYCVNNESGEQIEWSNYWADYLHGQAEKLKINVHITEMRRNEDVRAQDHLMVFDQSERYTFLDISQNNAWSGLGQMHYDNIMYVRDYISKSPRPINNIKNYGAARHGEEESVARFCRMVFAGTASARFHRPHPIEDPEMKEASTEFGLGLSPLAQSIIQSMRMVIDKLNLFTMNPNNELLTNREENEAYLLAEKGKQYALYFPKDAGDGTVTLDLTDAKGQWRLKWININESKWQDVKTTNIDGGKKIQITTPGEGHWSAVILPVD